MSNLIVQRFYGVRLGNNVKNDPKEYLKLTPAEIDDLEIGEFELDLYTVRRGCSGLTVAPVKHGNSVTHYLISDFGAHKEVLIHGEEMNVSELNFNRETDELFERFFDKAQLPHTQAQWLVVADYDHEKDARAL